jgi:hypothetical protein
MSHTYLKSMEGKFSFASLSVNQKLFSWQSQESIQV